MSSAVAPWARTVRNSSRRRASETTRRQSTRSPCWPRASKAARSREAPALDAPFRLLGAAQRDRAVARSYAQQATTGPEPAADAVARDLSRHVGQRDLANVDATVTGVRVQIGVEALGQLQGHGAVAGRDLPIARRVDAGRG